jgi:RecB family exonuclease
MNNPTSPEVLDVLWKDTWDRVKTAHSASTGQEEALWRSAGRATKEYPDKENEKWWIQHGRLMLDSWVSFRTGENGWTVWTTPEGIPAIELNLSPTIAGVPVQMGIDRIMVTPEGEMVIVDIKTGRYTPNPLQLAFYAAGIELTFGIRPQYGTYWMARSGTTSPLVSLDFYSTDKIEELVAGFDKARRNELLLPNFSHCKMCGFTTQCKWNMEGK